MLDAKPASVLTSFALISNVYPHGACHDNVHGIVYLGTLLYNNLGNVTCVTFGMPKAAVDGTLTIKATSKHTYVAFVEG